MNKRITEAFVNGKAFIPFLTCGDPSLEVTEQLVYAMEEAGADLIELGIPFSDPTAEGPVIQEANVRAFAGGVTTDKVFSMVEKIRKNTKIPMVFMTYANVVFSYGTERFIKKAAEVGMDGIFMNKRITEAFANGKAFIPFLTCGDPSLKVTEQLVYAMEEAGADLIELGIPFSDPTAEGPVIQEANVRAFAGGVTTDKVFSMVEKIRKNTKIPMVFMTYANVVFSYGTERFIKKAAEVGMDGLILPDVPFEEKEEFDVVCKQYGLDLISLIAPTSHERIAMIAKEAEGFVYCVSSLGVTGMRTSITTDIGAMVKLVKAQKDIPCAVGFGISTPEQAKKMADQSDGAIVGSAIVKLCGAYGKDCVPKVKAYVKEMKDAIR